MSSCECDACPVTPLNFAEHLQTCRWWARTECVCRVKMHFTKKALHLAAGIDPLTSVNVLQKESAALAAITQKTSAQMGKRSEDGSTARLGVRCHDNAEGWCTKMFVCYDCAKSILDMYVHFDTCTRYGGGFTCWRALSAWWGRLIVDSLPAFVPKFPTFKKSRNSARSAETP